MYDLKQIGTHYRQVIEDRTDEYYETSIWPTKYLSFRYMMNCVKKGG